MNHESHEGQMGSHCAAPQFAVKAGVLFRALLAGSVFFTAAALPAQLSMLAPAPDWSQLDTYQETISREEFVHLLEAVYAPDRAYENVIELTPEAANIKTSDGVWTLRFAKNKPEQPPRFWRPASARQPAAKPLSGVCIALDPGHLGGPWAQMEERWFQIGEGTKPVVEGDMALLVAKLLAKRLSALGADVPLVRRAAEPATNLRPDDLREAARTDLARQGVKLFRDRFDGPADPLKFNSIQWTSELLFYRTAEIRRRAQIVNRRLQPDLVLCLHFNAESWGDPKEPTLVEKNHLHLLVNGSYNKGELAFDDERFEMLVKLLTRTHAEELPAAENIADSLARATGLPPYEYTNGNARRIGANPYVWTRNLLANRLYACPVVYIEPYVMNSQAVWERVQLGDYEGEKMIGGTLRKSLYREYADAVAEGLADYYAAARPRRWPRRACQSESVRE